MQRILKPEVRIAASAALLQRGCVNVIGLEEIKSKAGARWPRMRESVYARMERLLRQKLGPADFFVQLDETSFLVSMPATTEEESQVFCIRVAHELFTRLLGRCDIEQLRIARPTRLDGNDLELEELTGLGLNSLAERAGLAIRAHAKAPTTQAPDRLEPRSAEIGPRHSCQFTPMWNPQKEAITTYCCRAAGNPPRFEYVMPDARFRADLACMLARVQCAATSLAEHLKAGHPFIVSIPISYLLLNFPVARMELAALCRGLSSGLRPFLSFEIADVPAGVPQSRLTELVGSLKAFCRGVSVNLSASNRNFNHFESTGFYAMSLSLLPNSGVPSDYASPERLLAEFCAATRRLHIMSFVMDVPNLKLLSRARELGVNLISGRLVGKPLEMPAPIRRLTIQEIVTASLNTDAGRQDESARARRAV